MKVFVATSEGQGLRPSDFFNSKEGNIVFFTAECGSDVNNIDGSCGCRRSMEDSESGTTTTFKVADLEINREEYFKKYNDYLIESRDFDPEEVAENPSYIQEDPEALLKAAELFPIGEVLEKRGNDIQPRPKYYFVRENDEY